MLNLPAGKENRRCTSCVRVYEFEKSEPNGPTLRQALIPGSRLYIKNGAIVPAGKVGERLQAELPSDSRTRSTQRQFEYATVLPDAVFIDSGEMEKPNDLLDRNWELKNCEKFSHAFSLAVKNAQREALAPVIAIKSEPLGSPPRKRRRSLKINKKEFLCEKLEVENIEPSNNPLTSVYATKEVKSTIQSNILKQSLPWVIKSVTYFKDRFHGEEQRMNSLYRKGPKIISVLPDFREKQLE